MMTVADNITGNSTTLMTNAFVFTAALYSRTAMAIDFCIQSHLAAVRSTTLLFSVER
jgi:hypothetical protein